MVPHIHNKAQFIDILNLLSMTISQLYGIKNAWQAPIQIFKLKNYEELYKHRLFNYSYFILHHVLILSGLSYSLKYEDRLITFQRIYESPNNILFNSQLQYNNQLVNDSFSILISIGHMLHINPNIQTHLNRFGTNPVEHNLEMIRMRSKDTTRHIDL